jgi:bifunctional enzyme CysN/CysC
MTAPPNLIAEDIESYLETHQHKSMLRFITCGSVDDGKSTLIGRLLYESHLVFEDHLAALEADSKKGTQGGELDFALLVDGLAAEREQGITIDVAYRFFATEKRKFIVADTLPAVIQEMLLTTTSERQGRVIDHDSAGSMEKKKQEGYF